MKDSMGNVLIAEAEDINDEMWKEVFNCLRKNGYKILFADGNFFNIRKEENEKNSNNI